MIVNVCNTAGIAGETRTAVPFKSAGDASLSFLAGEAGGPPGPGPIQKRPSSLPRDFVNPGYRPQQAPNVPATSGVPTALPGHVAKPSTPTRDFVNPNYKPNQPINPATTSKAPIATSVLDQKSSQPSRDFVNPNFKPNVSPISTPASSSSSTPSSVSLSQILKPGPPQPTGSRDYVNTNIKPRDPFPALRPSNQGGRESFPALGPAQSAAGRPASSGPSYAGAAAGGATTSRSLTAQVGGLAPGVVPGPSTKAPQSGSSDSQLREFSEQLLRKDVNNAAKYITLNLQSKTTSQSKIDVAPNKYVYFNQ